MGLDIVAYRGLERLPDHERTDQCFKDGHITIQAGGFPQPAGSFPNGCYTRDENLDKPWWLCFAAGSYSAYNDWREHLALMAHGVEAEHIWQNPERYPAFRELIDFTDCDGTLGTEICQKLADDFHSYLAKAVAYAAGDFAANLEKAKTS